MTGVEIAAAGVKALIAAARRAHALGATAERDLLLDDAEEELDMIIAAMPLPEQRRFGDRAGAQRIEWDTIPVHARMRDEKGREFVWQNERQRWRLPPQSDHSSGIGSGQTPEGSSLKASQA